MENATETPGGVPVYTVQTPVFEGPLEVLLSLIERRKLFINDISLAEVTDDFIRYIQEREDVPLQESTHFIYVASTLVLIKSKSLLPTLQLTEEEEESVEELERRLRAYKELKERSQEVRAVWGEAPLFFGEGEVLSEPQFSPDGSVTLEGLAQAVRGIVERFPTEESIPQTNVRETIKLETVISSLIDRIASEMQASFHEFSGLKGFGAVLEPAERVKVVVSFIALLELVKQGAVRVRQEERGGDIYIEGADVDTPRYM